MSPKQHNTLSTDVPGIAILGAGIFAKEGTGLVVLRHSTALHRPLTISKAYLPAIAALGGASAASLRAVYSRSHQSASDLAQAAQNALDLASPPEVFSDDGNSIDALLSRTDIIAVIVVLPITLQPSFVLKALAAGKHVLSEKPVAPDVKSGLALIKEYEEMYKHKGLIWRVAENYEAEPAYSKPFTFSNQ